MKTGGSEEPPVLFLEKEFALPLLAIGRVFEALTKSLEVPSHSQKGVAGRK